MKIAFFTDAYWPRVNGVSVSVDSFAHALIRSGNEVLIVCPMYPESSSIEKIDKIPDTDISSMQAERKPLLIRVPSTQFVFSREDRIAKFYKWPWISKKIDGFAPDLIHINTEFVIAEFGFQYAWFHKLPVVYTFHTLWEDYAANYLPLIPSTLMKRFIHGIIKNILRRANLIIAPTQQIGEVVRKYKIKTELRLLPTGIDPRLFDKSDSEIAFFHTVLCRKFPHLTGKRILLFAGRIAKEKNLDFLLSIVKPIVEKHPDVVFLLVGNGPDLLYFTEECERLTIEEYCIFSGYLSRDDLALTYRLATLFVFPSLTETQGLVTIEAMLSGTPVVAIGEMGTRTVMGGDNGGFMVHADKAEFIARVFDLLEDSALYQRKVAEAKQHAQKWTIDVMTCELEVIYRYVLKSYHGHKGRHHDT
ncbi:glycosyltransferase [Breznakiellaceae bacterium SP9]